MNYQEFLREVRVQLADRIEPGAMLRIQRMPRNNGTSYDGLIILRPGRNVSPTIYLTPYYHRYLDGVSMEDIFNDILATYQNHMPDNNFDTSFFTDFSKVQSRVVMRLLNRRRNEEMLYDVPHFYFQDLVVVFYCLLHADENNQASILVHNEHLQLWGIDLDTLHCYARVNTPRLLPYELTPMDDILQGYTQSSCLADCDIPMYVLSNKYRTNGAAALLYESVLQALADRLASDLIILPSSVHEVILVAAQDRSELEMCSQMVREVNETQLADDEILSDHAYYYDRKNRFVSM